MMFTRPLLGVSLLLLGVCSQESDWKPFTPKKGGFSILLPGKPSEKKYEVRTATGPVTVAAFSIEKDGATYVVAVSDFPKMKAGNEDKHLDNAKGGVIGKGKLHSENNVKLGKHPGRELLVETDEKFVRARLYAVNKRLYQTMMVGSKEQVSGSDAERFFDSFKLDK